LAHVKKNHYIINQIIFFQKNIVKSFHSVVLSRRVLEHFAYFHDTEAARGRHGHDRVVVGFTTTYAIGAYHH
jgi:hypothetical protein